MRYYNVIYNMIDEVKQAITGMLGSLTFKQNIIGLAEVRDVFRSPKFGAIAGCMVTEGNCASVTTSNPRTARQTWLSIEGELESLRRFKDDA
jgi:translation initiation factor IF-2